MVTVDSEQCKYVWAYTHIRLQLFGFSVEWIHYLPCSHCDDIDAHEKADDQIKLRVFHHFLIELYVGEDGVDPPRFAEHRTKTKGESWHQDPSTRRANVWKRVCRRHVGVEAEHDDGGVGEDAANDDQIIHVGRRHFDVSEVIVYIKVVSNAIECYIEC